MDNTGKISTAARRLRYVMIALLVIIPATNLAGWMFINSLTDGAFINAGSPDASGSFEIDAFMPDGLDDFLESPNGLPLPASARLLGFLASMLPTGVLMYGLMVLINLFRLYEAGSIFTPDNVRCYRRLAATLLWWVAANFVYQPLLSLALTLHNPPGERMVMLELGSPDLTALLVGSVLWVVAWVMAEGASLREEQELTV